MKQWVVRVVESNVWELVVDGETEEDAYKTAELWVTDGGLEDVPDSSDLDIDVLWEYKPL